MKKRKMFLGLLLAGACALVGVGYAAVTANLKIGGSLDAEVNQNALKVSFVGDSMFANVTPINNTTNITATPSFTDTKTANIHVSGMKDIGDKATAFFLVQNQSQNTARLTAELSVPNIIVNNGSTTATDGNADPEIFSGAHFTIQAQYVTNTGVDGKAPGTGTIADKKATIKTGEDGNGETVWVKVEISLSNVVVDTFPTHNITVSFTGTSTETTGA
jgi:hypothetical protein